MPQEMNILRCSSCNIYQVHIVKKAKKWQCKICNFKQTFKQAYFKGSGKDCRAFVQKLNLAKEHEIQESASFNQYNNINDNYANTCSEESNLKVTESKWAKYLDTAEEIEFNNFKASSSKSTNYEDNDTTYLSNDNATYKNSQNEYTNVNHKSSLENIIEEDYAFDNEERYDNSIPEEINTVSYVDNNSKVKNISETKCANNIFDDNEDFDLSIDF
ncbi:PREDICTED: UPF0544 protein C5orf45 [Eufriesea mexicana]|uniref:UPF0544 protein C5orf45 n=1 Tax=Eufriesea mexicana TaxID=516756 RepID=UPI00083C101A|nr:PREDICTED: UPF0544 protein C5orf45 [Eufriesea mexicana]